MPNKDKPGPSKSKKPSPSQPKESKSASKKKSLPARTTAIPQATPEHLRLPAPFTLLRYGAAHCQSEIPHMQPNEAVGVATIFQLQQQLRTGNYIVIEALPCKEAVNTERSAKLFIGRDKDGDLTYAGGELRVDHVFQHLASGNKLPVVLPDAEVIPTTSRSGDPESLREQEAHAAGVEGLEGMSLYEGESAEEEVPNTDDEEAIDDEDLTEPTASIGTSDATSEDESTVFENTKKRKSPLKTTPVPATRATTSRIPTPVVPSSSKKPTRQRRWHYPSDSSRKQNIHVQ